MERKMYSQRQPAYAPTPYSYTPTSQLSATINLDEEVKLTTSNTERDLYESLAEIYSIIITLDALERAFLKDSIAEADYTETCSRLLKQYKSNLADEAVSNTFEDLEHFKRRWQIEAPRATERIRIGIPATVEAPTQRGQASGGGGAAAALVISASENFITLLDALKLGMKSKDTLHPLLVDTIQSVNKVTNGGEFDGKEKIVQWLITLNQMRASQELDDDQSGDIVMQDEFQGVSMDHDDSISILDLPQLYQKPSKTSLEAAMDMLAVEPVNFSAAADQLSLAKRPLAATSREITTYLTSILASPLSWIAKEEDQDAIRELASRRITERAGRTAMASLSRTFSVPIEPLNGLYDASGDCLDIEIFEPALTGDNLGHKTWSSSYVLSRRLPEIIQTLPQKERPNTRINVLELGAGTGLLGIAFAALSGSAVLLTDLPEIVDNLERNISGNRDKLHELGRGSAHAAVLDWTRPDQILYAAEPTPDTALRKARVILAADPIYAPLHPSLLVQTISYYLDRKDDASRVIIGYPRRTAYATQIDELRSELHSCGLAPLIDAVEDDVRDDWDQPISVAWSVWAWKNSV